MWHTMRGIGFLVSHTGGGKQSLETLLSSSVFKALKKHLQSCNQRNKTDVHLPNPDARQPPGAPRMMEWRHQLQRQESKLCIWKTNLGLVPTAEVLKCWSLGWPHGISWNLLGALCGSSHPCLKMPWWSWGDLKCRGHGYPQCSGLWRKGGGLKQRSRHGIKCLLSKSWSEGE